MVQASGVSLVLIGAILAANVWQYGPASAAESRQKASLYGIELGTPLNIPQCPGGEINPLLVHTSCKNQTIKAEDGETKWLVVFPFFHSPPMVSDQVLLVTTISGRVEAISFATDGVRVQDEIFRQLVAKFGSPTASRVDAAQNAFGAHFQIRRARWVFDGFTVSFDGSDGKINGGAVAIKSAKFTAAERALQTRRSATEPKM